MILKSATAPLTDEERESRDAWDRIIAENDDLRARAERAERVVGLAWRFTASLGGARLRKSELDALDPLLVAMNAMPMADFARCLESARALAATGDEEGKGGESR